MAAVDLAVQEVGAQEVSEARSAVAAQSTRRSHHNHRRSILWAKAGYVSSTTHRMDVVAARVATMAASVVAVAAAEVEAASAVGR